MRCTLKIRHFPQHFDKGRVCRQVSTFFGFSCRIGDFSTLKCYHFSVLKFVEYCTISASAVGFCPMRSNVVDKLGSLSNRLVCRQLLAKQVEKLHLEIRICRSVSNGIENALNLANLVTFCNSL